MPFTTAGQLCRESPVARVDDPIGLVAENLRESHYGALPVIQGEMLPNGRPAPLARVVGVIYERDLSGPVLASGASASAVSAPRVQAATPFGSTVETATATDTTLADAPALTELRARDLIRPEAGYVPTLFSLPNVLLTLDRYECDALPVIDESGGYCGMISRADAVAALGRAVRPPSVGGMATPLGVWLTTGHLSSGAPTPGLFLSGMALGAMFCAAHLLMFLGLTLVNAEWGAMFLSGRLGAASDTTGLFNLAVTIGEGGLFILLMRLSPLAGYHAAEHQTVWAIERGVPLLPENVAQMPRPHPRCGTNLVALSGLIQIVLGHLPDNSPSTMLFALIFIYFFWRRFGEAIQLYGTTRPASRKQLESGIRAGKEIIEKYQNQPHLQINFGARLWNSGLLLAGGGMIFVWWLYEFVENWAAHAILG
jgi:CBS domain-containing protein